MQRIYMGSMVFPGCAMAIVGTVSRIVIHWAYQILHYCQGKQAGIDDAWELF